MAATSIRCHYEVLGVEQDADSSTIKKSHRKLALKYHPDKNLNDDNAAEQFRLIQQAYECLSDLQERKWYDDHRDAILAGWSSGDKTNGDMDSMMIFDVVHYMHPGCYNGYDETDKDGFYQVYKGVFEEIVLLERKGQSNAHIELPTEFGHSQTEWSQIQQFYQIWESFVSALNFAWVDKYNSREDAPDRRIRRLMDDENKKARRQAKKTYNQDILALVAFVKRRDPRVKAKQQELQQQKLEQQKLQKEKAAMKKQQQQKLKEEWMEQSQQHKEDMEEADRIAGRVRLADLDDDDYDYGGGKRRGKKGKRGKKKQQDDEEVDEEESTQPEAMTEEEEEEEAGKEDQSTDVKNEGLEETILEDANGVNGVKDDGAVCPIATPEGGELSNGINYDEYDDAEDSESEEESEPDVWRCECCRKEFKSEGQMENHFNSKKHKAAYKKFQAKMEKQQQQQQDDDGILADMMDEIGME